MSGLGVYGGSGAALGLDQSELLAAQSYLTTVGLTPETAAVGINNLLVQAARPNNQVAQIFQQQAGQLPTEYFQEGGDLVGFVDQLLATGISPAAISPNIRSCLLYTSPSPRDS